MGKNYNEKIIGKIKAGIISKVPDIIRFKLNRYNYHMAYERNMRNIIRERIASRETEKDIKDWKQYPNMYDLNK